MTTITQVDLARDLDRIRAIVSEWNDYGTNSYDALIAIQDILDPTEPREARIRDTFKNDPELSDRTLPYNF